MGKGTAFESLSPVVLSKSSCCSFYESGNCVQIICATQGVHPTTFSPTSVQFKSEINGAFPCKRHQEQHLEFLTALLRTN